jgi:hypothetical protein
MPVQPSYPGVYVEELSSGVRTIVGVATSVTAFVGRTLRGRLDEPIDCFSFADFERGCGGLWAESDLGYAVAQFFLNGGTHAIVSRVVTGATTASLSIAATDGGANFVLAASSPGAWGTALRATVQHGSDDSVDATPNADTFHLEVFEVDLAAEAVAEALPHGTPAETLRRNAALAATVRVREIFPHVSVDANAARWVGRVLEQESELARLTTASADRPIEVERAKFGAAVDGAVGAPGDYTAAIDRLDHVDLFNLLCIPPPSRTSDVPLSVWTDGLSLCVRRRAVLLVDPPSAWSTAQNAADLSGGYDALRSENVAFYWPRVLASDGLQEGRLRSFVPSGSVAGVIARTDADRGVWKSPAGLEASLSGVPELAVGVTDSDSGRVNPRGVNALRQIPPAGVIIWGARTARGADTLASPWKYLAVRRLALYIEESLFRGTQWAVFEPNDEPLWSQLRASIGAFMQLLFRQGAFQGSKASEAYFVRCDSSTTTAADVDRGIVNTIIGFAPLKPAEFVVLQFKQIAGQ